MRVLRDSSAILPQYRGGMLALGNFDGLHPGHLHVIEKAIGLARSMGKPAGMLSFEPHPRRLFQPDLPPLRILSLEGKLRRLSRMQLDMVRLIRFTCSFSQTTAAQFVQDILVQQMQVAHVVTGDDFIFGHNREGNMGFLRAQARKWGFGYTACAPVLSGGVRCSSSHIRTLLGEGQVDKAASMLGRLYSIAGRVQEGDKRGRLLGFPTANIIPAHIFTPATGVYAIRACINGQQLRGVANLGIRPTFGGDAVRLEAHLFDWSGDLYGRRMEVELVTRIRGERRFANMEALKSQIEQDAIQARGILRLA